MMMKIIINTIHKKYCYCVHHGPTESIGVLICPDLDRTLFVCTFAQTCQMSGHAVRRLQICP
jgi:hypothetical protein